MNNYMARVEQEVERSLLGAEVLAIMETEIHEREGYWERAYFVAWQNAGECGTHRVGIDSNDTSACMWGHYFHTKEEAMADFVERAFAGILGAKD